MPSGKLRGIKTRPSILLLGLFWGFSFLVVPALLSQAGVDFSSPETWPAASWGAFAVVALVADIALAVPTGVVATALGATYGFWAGTALAVVGIAGATLTGWSLGRAGSALARAIPDHDPVRAAVSRWGVVALVALRPIPVLAESSALVAGGEGLPAWKAVIAALLGALPTALLYVSIGAAARQIEAPVWAPLTLSVLLGALAAGVGRLLTRRGGAP